MQKKAFHGEPFDSNDWKSTSKELKMKEFEYNIDKTNLKENGWPLEWLVSKTEWEFFCKRDSNQLHVSKGRRVAEM